MPMRRRPFLAGLAVTAATAAAPGRAIAEAAGSDTLVDEALADLLARDPRIGQAALETIRAHGGPSAAAGLIFMMRFSPLPRANIVSALRDVTGEDAGDDWFDWMIWQETNPQIRPTPGYATLKRSVFLAIDPDFEVFLGSRHLAQDAMDIRFEEVTWGGVVKDGIPALDDPDLIEAGEAEYLREDDLVFGVSIAGDARAYPLRIMGWHEMVNDTVGGVPLALAYCTLCGAGILFETAVEGRPAPFVFGSSGFLYRSNKLMFDRETHSLWNQFTGRPVIGPLRGSGIALVQRPVAIETWGDWRRRNPRTRVLSLDTGYRRDYGSGVVYRDYFASPDLMFPTAVDESRLAQKAHVFGIRRFEGAKAWPLAAFAGGRVINDAIGGMGVVLIGDARGRTVRAYERAGLTFEPGPDGTVIASGTPWEIGEEALTARDGRRLPRVAGHVSYWFAWDGYLGQQSELWIE
jgi:hypothetical protein